MGVTMFITAQAATKSVSRAIGPPEKSAGHGAPPIHFKRRDPLDDTWRPLLARLDYALQPIVNIHTGYAFGYEALLRRHQEAGFRSTSNFFDACHAGGVLDEVDIALREMAVAKFAQVANHTKTKLFFNLDNRTLEHSEAGFEATRELLARHGLSETNLCLEISERHAFDDPARMAARLNALKRHTYKLALDDFGTGFSGLQTLYFTEPHVIKIDRFFISDISSDSRKRVFVSQIVAIAHLLGAAVVAESVETEQEFFTCKDIGCDLVQGYLIQHPTTDVTELRQHYEHVEELSRRERRNKSPDQKLLSEKIEAIPPLHVDEDMAAVFERFRTHKGQTLFPVIDSGGEPLGIVREADLKEYTYSAFGKDLICNKSYGRKLSSFLTRCPIADVKIKAENILQIFSTTEETTEGLIIVENMRYIGFLSARSLLQVIHEKSLAAARDQNPLTRLPGNTVIHEYVSNTLSDTSTPYVFAYFDFDNFKPFNDKYGFRLGDRAILMFAERLSKKMSSENCFVGHVGGDDFFAGFRGCAFDHCVAVVDDLIQRFRSDVESLYEDEVRREGHVMAVDRHGTTRRFPLLSASAAILQLPAHRPGASTDDVGTVIADLKKEAKESPSRTCAASLIAGRPE